jgi:hypothetical protein
MSYKQFIAELEDDILPGEAERRYVCSSPLRCNFVCEGKRCVTSSIGWVSGVQTPLCSLCLQKLCSFKGLKTVVQSPM